MKVTITIECETGGELLSHLHVLKQEAIKAIKQCGKDGFIKKPIVLEDSNCYGSHEAKIKDFCADELLDEYNRGLYPFRNKKLTPTTDTTK